jgi:2-polyprenyl-6-methoxyphenol hydroxylase-like FAD-dependent oxidoreductase
MPAFRVIIVGGGPAGLIAAHALSHAGIDFVVLERRPDIIEDVGAGLVLGSQSLRVMSQLGLLDRLQSIGTILQRVVTSTVQGRVYNSSEPFTLLGKK